MPIYDYECPECGYIGEHFLPLGKCNERVFCDVCFIPMRKIITKVPLHSYSNRPNERPWGTGHWRSDKKKGGKG